MDEFPSGESLERLIARYIGAECTPAEAGLLERRMQADAQLAAEVAEMQRLWQATSELRSPWDSRAAWQAIKGRTIARPIAVEAVRRSPLTVFMTNSPRPIIWRAAAAVLVALAGSLWWYTNYHSRAEVLREVSTQRGQLATIDLIDGTRVLLGVESRLRFHSKMSRRSRDVYLDGAAVFDVKHDTKHPFVVHTREAVARDLGTTFGVRAYATDSTTTVVVKAGRVALRAAFRGRDARSDATVLVLDAGDLGRASAAGAMEKKRGVRPEDYLAWSERRLVFTDVPMRDVVAELARWHDLDFRFADSAVANLRLTAAFQDETAAELLDDLALTLDLHVMRDSLTVTFARKHRSKE